MTHQSYQTLTGGPRHNIFCYKLFCFNFPASSAVPRLNLTQIFPLPPSWYLFQTIFLPFQSPSSSIVRIKMSTTILLQIFTISQPKTMLYLKGKGTELLEKNSTTSMWCTYLWQTSFSMLVIVVAPQGSKFWICSREIGILYEVVQFLYNFYKSKVFTFIFFQCMSKYTKAQHVLIVIFSSENSATYEHC